VQPHIGPKCSQEQKNQQYRMNGANLFDRFHGRRRTRPRFSIASQASCLGPPESPTFCLSQNLLLHASPRTGVPISLPAGPGTHDHA
jgi:hypothetical protein